jgi:hypothetical protein
MGEKESKEKAKVNLGRASPVAEIENAAQELAI